MTENAHDTAEAARSVVVTAARETFGPSEAKPPSMSAVLTTGRKPLRVKLSSDPTGPDQRIVIEFGAVTLFITREDVPLLMNALVNALVERSDD